MIGVRFFRMCVDRVPGKIRACGRRTGAATGIRMCLAREFGLSIKTVFAVMAVGASDAASAPRTRGGATSYRGDSSGFVRNLLKRDFDADRSFEKARDRHLGSGPSSMRWGTRRRQIRFEGHPEESGCPSRARDVS